jgi:hypothetical protein
MWIELVAAYETVDKVQTIRVPASNSDLFTSKIFSVLTEAVEKPASSIPRIL